MQQPELLSETLQFVSESRKGHELSDPQAERAAQMKEVMRRLLNTERSLGHSLLIAMWQFYIEGLCMFDGNDGQEYNPEQFDQWVEDTLVEYASNETYVRQLANVVTRILQDVHAKPRTIRNALVTPDVLLGGEKLISRLTTASKVYSLPDTTEEQRIALLEAILYGSNRGVVAALVAEISNAGWAGLKLPAPSRTILPDGTTRWVFDHLNATQDEMLFRITQRLLEREPTFT